MALAPLANLEDLSNRNEAVAATDLGALMLEVASSLVREAAGSPISQTTATLSFWAVERGEWLDVPVRPVTSVSAVSVDGSAVTDFKLVYGDLWRRCGWFECEPTEVTVTAVIGLPVVPEHIVQLVCDLAILGAKAAEDGSIDPRVVAESIDDYSVTFAQGSESVASAMTIPARTRLSLRTRFGGGAGSVRFK